MMAGRAWIVQQRGVLACDAGEEAHHFFRAVDRVERRGALAAAIAVKHDVFRQNFRQTLHVARRRRLLKRRSQAMPVLMRSGKTRPPGFDVAARTRRELAAGRLGAAQRLAHLRKIEAEHIVQQKARTLERRQTLKNEHQRHRNIVRHIACLGIVEGLVDDRLRQPLADIEFAPRSRRFHAVETESRHHGTEIMRAAP